MPPCYSKQPNQSRAVLQTPALYQAYIEGPKATAIRSVHTFPTSILGNFKKKRCQPTATISHIPSIPSGIHQQPFMLHQQLQPWNGICEVEFPFPSLPHPHLGQRTSLPTGLSHSPVCLSHSPSLTLSRHPLALLSLKPSPPPPAVYLSPRCCQIWALHLPLLPSIQQRSTEKALQMGLGGGGGQCPF